MPDAHHRWRAGSADLGQDAAVAPEGSEATLTELAGQRAAIVMSLVQSARMNGHEPWAYLRDVLQRLPTLLNTRLDELLPHRWTAAKA